MNEKGKQTKIGKYEILEKIGEGGFGIVYRGQDPLLDRLVAVKVLKSEAASSPEFVERFRREARLAASLRHPNIVNVIEVGEHEGHHFLVMDLLPGGTLSELLKDGKPLPISKAVELLKPIAEALDYAHRKGMIHRDVKPSNIILNEDGQPVLTDFGLGKSLNEVGVSTTGMPLGTAEYMSPEQILGNAPGPATDTYALGVIAFQMLTGQVPFSGTTPYTIQKGHAEGTPPDPRKINPALGEKTTQVLLKSLEKEPQSRFQSGAELAAALSAISEQEQEVYWKALYAEAKALMDKKEFTRAIEKWETLLKARPGFQDAPDQIASARQQLELGERYDRLVKQVGELKTEAQAILSIDENYPDGDGVFEYLGLLGSRPVQPKLIPSKDKTEALPIESQLKPVQNRHLYILRFLAGFGFIGLLFTILLFLSSQEYWAIWIAITTGIIWLIYFVVWQSAIKKYGRFKIWKGIKQ
jgi:serine/threonine protein kinase